MKKLLAILLIPLSVTTAAGTEAEIACDLERAKAEVLAATVEAPYLYGSVSNAANDRGATLGAGYSLSGRLKGKLMRESASAKCSAIAATIQLEEQQSWLLTTIRKTGARAELKSLLEARQKINEHILALELQLKNQTITAAEFNSAKQTQVGVEDRINNIRMLLAEPTQPINIIGLKNLIDTARNNIARAAELDAKIQAENSWDVSAVFGGRKEFGDNPWPNRNNNSPGDPFVGLTFRWSFGAEKSYSAVKTVRQKTEELFANSKAGYAQTIDRLIAQINEFVRIESEREIFLDNQYKETNNWISSFKRVDTALAINSKRALEIQALIQKSELEGVRRRLAEYRLFISNI